MNKYTPETLTVQVAYTIRKRGGRKEFVLPERAVTRDAKPNSSVVKALARAFRWQRMLDSGEFATMAELAAKEGLAVSYLARVLRLLQLAPDFVEAIMAGTQPTGMTLAVLMEPFPAVWGEQVKLLRSTKVTFRL